MQSITIPSGVTKIGSSAFVGCSSLQSITIPSGVNAIGVYAFSGCSSLQSITIPSGVTEIAYGAFRGCSSLQSITIPSGVTEIGRWAFDGCSSLQSITIPEGVTEIGSGVFENCSTLSSIVIPDSVVKIVRNAFSGCSSLRTSNLSESVKQLLLSSGFKLPKFYNFVYTYKHNGDDAKLVLDFSGEEIQSLLSETVKDMESLGIAKAKELIKDNDGEISLSIYDPKEKCLCKDLLLDQNLEVLSEDCCYTLLFEDVQEGFYMICGIDDEALGAELENCIKQGDRDKFMDLFSLYDCDFQEVSAGYSCGWDDKIKYSIYDENGKRIKRGSKKVHEDNIFKYTPNYEGDDCFKEINTKYIVMCYDAYSIGLVPFPVPKDFDINYIHFNDGCAFHEIYCPNQWHDEKIDLTQIHYKGKMYEADMDDIGINGTYGISRYYLYKKDENGRYESLGSIRPW